MSNTPPVPPSFSSFPDFEAGPSQSTSDYEFPSKHSGDNKRKKRHHSKERQSSDRTNKHDRITRLKSPSGKARERERDWDIRLKHNNDYSSYDPSKEKRDSELINTFFFSDRKGDTMNIQYGKIHAGDVPKYRMVNGGRNVLGLPKALVVLRRSRNGVEIGLNEYYRKVPDLSSSSSRALLSKLPTRRLITSSEGDQYEEVDGIIRFPSRRPRENTMEAYRSIETSKNIDSDASFSSGDDEQFSSEEDTGQTPLFSAHQETLKRLQQEVDTKPESVDAWMSLLDQTLSTIPITSKNASKARSDITVSILSRALEAAPGNKANKRLRLVYLKAGEEIWHESKLKWEWEDALKVGGIELLMEWIEWNVRRANQGLDGIIDSTIRALASLGNDVESEMASIRIFWRIATAIRSAGYHERATGMFQAQAELLFHVPATISNAPFAEQLKELEAFWDSECPRIGEDYAKGWAYWHTNRQTVASTQQTLRPPEIRELDPYRQWAAEESLMDSIQYLPLRSNAESTDPYASILFTDIRPTLLHIKSRRAKEAFRMAWLSFIGLPVPGFSLAPNHEMDWDDRWNLAYLTTPSSLKSIFPSIDIQPMLLTDAVAGVVIGRERYYTSPFGPVRFWGEGVSRPLDLTSAEPGKTVKRGLWSSSDLNVDESFVRNVFAGLRFSQDDYDWDYMTLVFEVAVNPKGAIKVSKSLLSAHREALTLWDCHAQLERLRGKIDNARKVYQTVLMGTKPDKLTTSVSHLWWNWAEMEWLAGQDREAINVILKSIDMQGADSSVTILRAKRSLEEIAVLTRLRNGWKEQEGWVKLCALLDLLTGSGTETVFNIFGKYSDSMSAESFDTAALVMVYTHGIVLKNTTSPTLLRNKAHEAFEKYPRNSIILGILLETEKGQGVWGRIRGLIGGSDGKAKSVARRVEEVWIAGWESGRWESEIERTRNGLAAAVEYERTRGSPVIWRIYLEFEIRAKALQRAKNILYRAIGDCPLVKEFYLLAFGPLRSVFEAHELNGLADAMVERGIRLHKGLDEVVSGTKTVMEDESKRDTDDSEDEIEYNARELHRLMPY